MNTYIKNNLRSVAFLISAAFAAVLIGCGPKETAVEAVAGVPATKLTSLKLDVAPSNPLTVRQAREQSSPNEAVVVMGQIGGVTKPFLEGYAGFVMGDTDIMFCDEMGDDDHCATPWDACCEDPDRLQANRLSVQFVNAEGEILEGDLETSLGLAGLDTVLVMGKVSAASNADNLVVEATGIYKVP